MEHGDGAEQQRGFSRQKGVVPDGQASLGDKSRVILENLQCTYVRQVECRPGWAPGDGQHGMR